jgi:hypothetical protein
VVLALPEAAVLPLEDGEIGIKMTLRASHHSSEGAMVLYEVSALN